MALCSSEYTLEYKIEMSLKKLKKEEATIAVQSTMVEMVEFKYHNETFVCFPPTNVEEKPLKCLFIRVVLWARVESISFNVEF